MRRKKSEFSAEAAAGYLRELDHVFQKHDGYDAQEIAGGILQSMAADPGCLLHILKNILLEDDLFSSIRNGPVVPATLRVTNRYVLRMYAFFPLPDRAGDISHNWIHHHDRHILTTVNAFGDEGYDSMIFNEMPRNQVDDELPELRIVRDFAHRLHNREIIPAFVPHLVFIPRSLTITYALWSSERSTLLGSTQLDAWRQATRRSLSAGAQRVHLKAPLKNLLFPQNRQFAPDGRGFKRVGSLEYSPSSNENVLQNLFHLLQQVGFKDEAVLDSVTRRAAERQRPDVVDLVERLQDGDRISDLYDPAHIGVPDINFTRKEVLVAAEG